MKNYKIKDFDDIYFATKESQGSQNALLAIKYVLFDDETVFESNQQKEQNKYLYISNINNARQKALLMQKDDLAHILIKYCLQSFGLRNQNFQITDDDLINLKSNINTIEITPYDFIEYIAYSSMGDIYFTYDLLYSNKTNLIGIVEYMIKERYKNNFLAELDNFNGLIDNKDMSQEIKIKYLDTYEKLDTNFAELKRNDQDYIK